MQANLTSYMIPYLFHIYGPFYANFYGMAVGISILIFTYLVNHDPRRSKLITSDKLQKLILWGTLVGVIGGRLLWAASNLPISWYELFEIWQGGLSVLGSIIAILLFAAIYLKQQNIPVLPMLDLVAIYAPLLQAIARLGCFMAGCCYGLPTNHWWGVRYTHPDIYIPSELKCLKLHPTQIYSALILFIVFLLMYNLISKYFKKPGQLIAIYLMLSSLERFLVDYLRADQEFCMAISKLLSIHQMIALGTFVIAGLSLFWARMDSTSSP